MITIRRASERGQTEIDWLHSRHTFSFGEYYDARHMGHRSLRVINDDVVEPGKGFGTHPHRDMEIITVVLDGALEHRDSLGHGEVLRPGEVQVMTAGRGIRHSEFNPSPTERVHLLQIWILPETRGLDPAYGQRMFAAGERHNTLRRVAGRDNLDRDGALKIHQDADLYVGTLDAGKSVRTAIRPGRSAFVHVATGAASVAGQALSAGDAAVIESAAEVVVDGTGDGAELLVFDLGPFSAK